jgi:hypothetical protein
MSDRSAVLSAQRLATYLAGRIQFDRNGCKVAGKVAIAAQLLL